MTAHTNTIPVSSLLPYLFFLANPPGSSPPPHYASPSPLPTMRVPPPRTRDIIRARRVSWWGPLRSSSPGSPQTYSNWPGSPPCSSCRPACVHSHTTISHIWTHHWGEEGVRGGGGGGTEWEKIVIKEIGGNDKREAETDRQRKERKATYINCNKRNRRQWWEEKW